MIYKSLTIAGLLVGNFNDRIPEFHATVDPLVAEGKIKFDETFYKGFDQIPHAFAGLFQGHNTGKAVVALE